MDLVADLVSGKSYLQFTHRVVLVFLGFSGDDDIVGGTGNTRVRDTVPKPCPAYLQ